MILSIIILSFFSQSIISNFISLNTKIWSPLFVLSSLILIYPCFKANYKFYITSFLMGFLYDFLFSQFLLKNALLFLILGYVIHFLYKNFQGNVVSNNIFLVITITIYRILEFLLLVMLENNSFSVRRLLKIICSSLLLNIIYITIIYLIINFISKKIKNRYKIRKV